MRTLLLVAAVSLLLAAVPREAAADGSHIPDEAITAGWVLAGVYACTTVGMGVYDVAAGDPSARYGKIEAAVHTPLAIVFAAGTISMASEWRAGDPDNSTIFVLGGLAAVHAALAVHGFYTAGKRRPPAPVDGPRVTVTPVSDGRSLGGGLGVVGTF